MEQFKNYIDRYYEDNSNIITLYEYVVDDIYIHSTEDMKHTEIMEYIFQYMDIFDIIMYNYLYQYSQDPNVCNLLINIVQKYTSEYIFEHAPGTKFGYHLYKPYETIPSTSLTHTFYPLYTSSPSRKQELYNKLITPCGIALSDDDDYFRDIVDEHANPEEKQSNTFRLLHCITSLECDTKSEVSYRNILLRYARKLLLELRINE